MNYHLSTNSILTTIHAMAALQAIAADDDGRAVLAPVLNRSCPDMLAVMIRNAFADIAMGLGPLVLDIQLDDETASGPGAEGDDAGTATVDMMLSVELLTPRTFTTSRHGIVRRALEQAVALTALQMWCMASEHGEGSSAEMAGRFGSVADEWLATLRSALEPTIYPTVRAGW